MQRAGLTQLPMIFVAIDGQGMGTTPGEMFFYGSERGVGRRKVQVINMVELVQATLARLCKFSHFDQLRRGWSGRMSTPMLPVQTACMCPSLATTPHCLGKLSNLCAAAKFRLLLLFYISSP